MPFLLFSFHAGPLADRDDCRRLIQISQALFVVASIAWGVLFLTDTLQMWHASRPPPPSPLAADDRLPEAPA